MQLHCRLPVVAGFLELLLESTELKVKIFVDEADKTIPQSLRYLRSVVTSNAERFQVYFVTATPAGLFSRFGEIRVHENVHDLENYMAMKDMPFRVVQSRASDIVGEMEDMLKHVPYDVKNFIFAPARCVYSAELLDM